MPWGGSEELWSRAALEISRRGYKVFVSVKEWQPVPAGIQNLEREGVEIIKRRKYRYSVKERITVKLGLANFKNQYDILKESPNLVVINQ